MNILSATLYTLLALGANALSAETYDADALRALRTGDMRTVAIHAEPKPIIAKTFSDVDGTEIDLTAFEGKTILLNFWATWCAPCRAEMPSLDALNQTLGGEDFEVVTIATGRNPIPAVDAFFQEIDVKTLPKYRDPKMTFSRASGVFGLPVTLILDPKGQEIARVQGEADWNSPDAHTLLKAIIATN